MTRQTSIQVSEAMARQVEALKARGFGTFTDVVRTAVDRLYIQEAGMAHNMQAETIYTEVYGDIDHRAFHRDMVRDIEDWLEEGEPVTGETTAQLARQWHQEHTGDEDATDRLGADDWVQVEMEYWALSQSEVRARLDGMFPDDDNRELADHIYSALH